MTANTGSLWFLDTEIGLWTVIAFAVVCAFNVPAMIVLSGLTRLMSFPHFVRNSRANIFHSQLFDPNAIESGNPTYIFGATVFVVNGFSLLFGAMVCFRWFCGGRGILGIGA